MNFGFNDVMHTAPIIVDISEKNELWTKIKYQHAETIKKKETKRKKESSAKELQETTKESSSPTSHPYLSQALVQLRQNMLWNGLQKDSTGVGGKGQHRSREQHGYENGRHCISRH